MKIIENNPNRETLRDLFSVIVLCVLLSILIYLPTFFLLQKFARADVDYFYFHQEFTQRSLLAYHQIPFWNPYISGGFPEIGNPQERFFSPALIFSMILGSVAGAKIEALFHVFLGILGTHFLAKYQGIKAPWTILAGFLFMGNPDLVFHNYVHLNWLSLAYLPYILLFYLQSRENPQRIIWAGIALSLMFYSGATYTLIFSVIFLTAYGLWESVRLQNTTLIKHLFLLILIFIVLSAPRLFPIIELLGKYPRYTPLNTPIPMNQLGKLFLDRNQFSLPHPGHRNQAYIGIVPLLLSLYSLKSWKIIWPLIVTSLFLLLICFGAWAPWAPWTLLHKVPLFNNLHIPARMFVVFFLPLALLTAQGATLLFSTNRPIYYLLACAIFLGITVDLITIDWHILQMPINANWANVSDQCRLGHCPRPTTPFRQVRVPVQRNPWNLMYPQLLNNSGVIDGYEPLLTHKKTGVTAKKMPNYQGEFFLKNGNGQVSITDWSPNKIVYSLSVPGKDTLILNQNFNKNWKCLPRRQVLNDNGRVAINVEPRDQTITLYYFPDSFLWGILFLLGGCGLYCVMARTQKRYTPASLPSKTPTPHITRTS